MAKQSSQYASQSILLSTCNLKYRLSDETNIRSTPFSALNTCKPSVIFSEVFPPNYQAEIDVSGNLPASKKIPSSVIGPHIREEEENLCVGSSSSALFM